MAADGDLVQDQNPKQGLGPGPWSQAVHCLWLGPGLGPTPEARTYIHFEGGVSGYWQQQVS